MSKQRTLNSKKIALPAISAALGTILLTVGAFAGIGEFFWYFAASVCVLLTFGLKSLWCTALSFVVCALLTMLTTGFNIIFLLPYLIFFGAYPILLYIEIRYNGNKVMMTAIGCVWFDAAMYVLYLFTKLFVTDIAFINNNIILIILVGGSLVFLAYRFAMKDIFAKLTERFGRLIG